MAEAWLLENSLEEGKAEGSIRQPVPCYQRLDVRYCIPKRLTLQRDGSLPDFPGIPVRKRMVHLVLLFVEIHK